MPEQLEQCRLSGKLTATAVILGFLSVFAVGLAPQLLLPGKALAARQNQQREVTPPLQPASFANRIVLDGEAGSILSLVLPEEVYLGLHRQDHRDLCVFDADGVPVPFNVGAAVSQSELPAKNINLRFYPWRPAPGAESGASTPRAADIEISANGNIIRIIGQGGGEKTPDSGLSKSPAYYLLDMSDYLTQLEPDKNFTDAPAGTANAGRPAWSGLTLTADAPSDFACYLSMSTSDDFGAWQPAGSRQAWIRSRHGGNTLENLTVNLPAELRRYLLLKLEGDAVIPEKLTARIEFTTAGNALTRQRTVQGEVDKQKRSVTYDLGGFLNLRELSFELPQNELVGVNLYSADRPKGAWRYMGQTLLYRLPGNGTPVTNPPFRLNGSARYWKVEVRDDIPFASAPALQAGWQPDELRFLARGKSPWTLAFGREHPVSAGNTPLDSLGQAQPAHIVSLGGNTPSGTSPVQAAENPAQNRILWGVLILGVVFLSGVAIWLSRSMRKNGGK